MACINIKHPEYINLVSRLSEFGITNPVDIQGKIHEYQEETNTDLFPGLDYFNIEDEVVNNVLEKRQNKIQANQQQLSVIDNVDTLQNFEQYFPDYSYLNEEERIVFIKGIESGDLTITCTTGIKAKFGYVDSKRLGNNWSLVKDLKGYKSHEYGGVDITVNSGKVNIADSNATIEAENGLVIYKA